MGVVEDNISDGAGVAGERPRFSFLTTAYRSEDTLPTTIGSVLAQTCDDWELVVVDNGMSDSIAAIVEPHLADPRIRLVRHENRGALGGVASAAEHATGQYLVVLNSDDTIVPEYCAVMNGWLETYPKAIAIVCDAVVVNARDGSRRRSTYLRRAGLKGYIDPDRPLDLADIIDGPCPYYTAPIRRETWDELGGMSPTLSRVGDLGFWLRALGAGLEVRQVPDVLCHYFVAAGSVSQPVTTEERDYYSDELEGVLAEAAEASGRPEDLQALARVRRRLHYQRALRQARAALRAGAGDEALARAREARHIQHTPRATVLVAGLRMSPGAVVRLYPAKQVVHRTLGAWQQRLRSPRTRKASDAATR